jgi:prepilin-type N-terminal cleavage/methylation domain-containing protein
MTSIRPLPAPGFTLVEILTATAIMAVIVGFVMTIMSQVLDVWNSSSDELELSGQAQVTLDLMKQDIEQAFFRHDGSQWLTLTSEVPVAVGSWNTQSYPSLSPSNTTASRLMLFAPTTVRETTDSANPPNPIFGDLCAIEYRMTYGPLFPVNKDAQPVLALHRAVLNPEISMLGLNPTGNFTLMTTSPTPGPAILQAGNTTDMDLISAWNAIDLNTQSSGTDLPKSIPSTGPNGTGSMNVYGGTTLATTILYNVAQFIITVNFYDTTQPSGISAYSYTAFRYGGNQKLNGNSTLQPLTFPPIPAVSPSNPAVDDYPGVLKQLVDTTMPAPYNLAYADITLTLLTDEGSYAFAKSPSTLQTSNPPLGGGTQSAWTQFLLQYGRTYTERVYFQNTPQ